MEISADLRNKLVDEAIAICDLLEDTFGVTVTPGTYAAMTQRLIAVAEMVLEDAATTLPHPDAMVNVGGEGTQDSPAIFVPKSWLPRKP